MNKQNDPTDPLHYEMQSGREVVDFEREFLTQDGFLAHCQAVAVEYIVRAPNKNGADDFAKAAWWAQMAAHTLNPEKYKDPRNL